jgi:hypothetical protein
LLEEVASNTYPVLLEERDPGRYCPGVVTGAWDVADVAEVVGTGVMADTVVSSEVVEDERLPGYVDVSTKIPPEHVELVVDVLSTEVVELVVVFNHGPLVVREAATFSAVEGINVVVTFAGGNVIVIVVSLVL